MSQDYAVDALESRERLRWMLDYILKGYSRIFKDIRGFKDNSRMIQG
jgi:hypothetical protein